MMKYQPKTNVNKNMTVGKMYKTEALDGGVWYRVVNDNNRNQLISQHDFIVELESNG